MIIHLKPEIGREEAEKMAAELQAAHLVNGKGSILVTSSKLKEVEAKFDSAIAEKFVFGDDLQLGNRAYRGETRQIRIGDLVIGGSSNNTIVITGPCSVESEEQIDTMAQMCVDLGLGMLRGGAYKPRTSPYSFQGLGLEGLKLLAKMRDKYGLKIITEVRDATHIEEVIEYSDVIQIGAKSMYDHGILRRCGTAGKPVMIKRGFGTFLQEFVQAAEFILSGGNEDVILCERGIRTFENKTRFTLDLCGVAYLKEKTNLPVILDPSHAMGFAYGVADLTRACVAMGVDGVIIESHPNPKVALSDASQQLNPDEFRELFGTLGPVAAAVGRNII